MAKLNDINEGLNGFGGRMVNVNDALMGEAGNYVEQHLE